MKLNRITITTVSLFAGLAFAGGYLFIAIPNVEIFTAVVFVAGVLLGARNGALVGIIAQTFFSLLNPFGMSLPPLLLAQVLNRALVGYAGGKLRNFSDFSQMKWKNCAMLGLTGLVLTWLYDLMAYLSFFFISGFSMDQMKTTFALGLPFYLIHGLVNTAIFVLVLPLLIRGLLRIELLNTARLS